MVPTYLFKIYPNYSPLFWLCVIRYGFLLDKSWFHCGFIFNQTFKNYLKIRSGIIEEGISYQ